VYRDPAGTVYQGEWVEDRREGFAIFASAYCKYEGAYFANKRHGLGKEVDGMGNIFVGEYCEGKAVKGKMNYANGDVYVGEWDDDERHGQVECKLYILLPLFTNLLQMIIICFTISRENLYPVKMELSKKAVGSAMNSKGNYVRCTVTCKHSLWILEKLGSSGGGVEENDDSSY
tara:strand:+ start:446 stop:967 length:522 start_codon:yes stop_codon:yes gene_type:complete